MKAQFPEPVMIDLAHPGSDYTAITELDLRTRRTIAAWQPSPALSGFSKWAKYWWEHPEVSILYDLRNFTIGFYYDWKKDRVCFRFLVLGIDLQF